MSFDFKNWDIHVGTPHPFNAEVPRPDNGTARLDPKRYKDPEFARAEWEKVFTKTWLLAGVVSDIPEAGDFFRFNIGDESFLIARDEDGSIKAHYNVCPHRGSMLALVDFGSVDQFTCPFHSWQFNIDGTNAKVTDEETFHPDVLCHGTDLSSVRCEEVAGLIFISMNPDVPPLREYLGVVADHFTLYDIPSMNVVQHKRSDWAANWKGGADAFYELYHLHAVHPQTQGMMDDRTQIDLYPNGIGRQFVPFGQPSWRFPDQETINPGIAMLLEDAGLKPEEFPKSAKDGRAALQQAKRARSEEFELGYEKFSDSQLSDAVIYSIFPNVQIGCHPEAVFIHRFLPNAKDPEQFTYDTMVLFKHEDIPGYGAPAWMGLAEGTDTTGDIRPEIEYVPLGVPPHLGQVLDQDSELLPFVQMGARSRGFRGPLWSEQEARLRHFHVELDRYLDGSKKWEK